MIVTTLGNKLRVVTEQSAGPVSYIGLAVNAGSRDDFPSREGLAHFLEHTIFKGTRKRRAWHISNRMESVGGELNAFTTKELTMLYTVAPAGHTERALELLADLVCNASFPEVDVLRERDIIIEEINSYHDSPSDAVFDEFDELLYKGSGMAHNILGSRESVRALTGSDSREFLDRFYTPANMVLYCVDSNPERALRLAERYFGAMHHDPQPHLRTAPELMPPFDEERNRDNSQANTVLGCRVPGRHDPMRYALMLFNNILGGPAINSLLCQQVRERRGLAYTIESNLTLMSDCGSFTVYFGTDHASVNRCTRLTTRLIEQLAEKQLGERAFIRARDQYCGQLAVAGDNRENCAITLGRTLLQYGSVQDLRHTAEHIRDVSAENLREAAAIVAGQTLSRLTLL